MARKKINHKYLLSLFERVDEFLDENNTDTADAIVSFCIVAEKLLKLKLYSKNPILVFDTSKMKDDNSIAIISLKKEDNIETAQIKSIISRFRVVFRNLFTDIELEILSDIYNLRNFYIHGYKADNEIRYDEVDIRKKMGALWPRLQKIAVSVFGSNIIKKSKPKKKYTEAELEKILEDEVEKMIKPLRGTSRFDHLTESGIKYDNPYINFGHRCPRCDSTAFALGGLKYDGGFTYDILNTISTVSAITNGRLSEYNSNLYKCESCNLELTEKQYQIARKLRGYSNN